MNKRIDQVKPVSKFGQVSEAGQKRSESQPFYLDSRLWGVIAVVLIAAALRLIPHPPNFSPIAAMALFGGAVLSGEKYPKWLAFAVPLAAMLASDLILGTHALMPVIYLTFIAITALGYLLRNNRTVTKVGSAAILSSALFFLVTNFAVWAQSNLYPMTGEGLMASYIAAIPFLQYSLMGDLLFSGLIFGVWALAEKSVPHWRMAH